MMMRFLRVLVAVSAVIAGAGGAQAQITAPDETEGYVSSNLLAIFYHEMGHALIDIMGLPIFGQEEDAADVVSILMITEFFDEEAAVQIAYDTAFGFLTDAELSEDVAYWDTHGPDLQRYYTTVCLFVGANFEAREDIAEDLELPEERLDGCEDEYDLAYDSWGPVLDELEQDGGGAPLVYLGAPLPDRWAQLTHEVISAEVENLNAEFSFVVPIDVRVEPCGEANAFYDLDARAIIMCTEFAEYLAHTAPQ